MSHVGPKPPDDWPDEMKAEACRAFGGLMKKYGLTFRCQSCGGVEGLKVTVFSGDGHQPGGYSWGNKTHRLGVEIKHPCVCAIMCDRCYYNIRRAIGAPMLQPGEPIPASDVLDAERETAGGAGRVSLRIVEGGVR